MRPFFCVAFGLMIAWALVRIGHASGTPVSAASQECLDCHATFHPGIVADWEKSQHASVTTGTSKRISATDLPEFLAGTVVGCAECHTLRPEAHADTFDHNGHRVHLVPSPEDCAVCHTRERAEFKENIMSMAEKNLAENTLYQDLQRTILGAAQATPTGLAFAPPDAITQADACFYCHGTRLTVTGRERRETDVGELEFPVIDGWPNHGVGRVNLDGSRGGCGACHSRHRFSIETARKPDACKECHAGPDVPAYKIYTTGKHGALYQAHGQGWRFDPTPWTVGRDFTAPTCATCHISQIATPDGEVIAQRTHRMNDRLGWRLFGLIYAHPQPKSGDTTPIRNRSGLPLPTDLDGAFAQDHLISPDEIAGRRTAMQAVCRACHGHAWVSGHFKRLDHVIATTNAAVATATGLMQTLWKKGRAQGPDKGDSMFDEAVERRWSDMWLIHANNVRFSSAMAGGGDYGVFEDGRYPLSKALMELREAGYGP